MTARFAGGSTSTAPEPGSVRRAALAHFSVVLWWVSGGPRKWGASPFLGVLFCGQCGRTATRHMVVKRGKVYAY
jgi:hypothetical protein